MLIMMTQKVILVSFFLCGLLNFQPNYSVDPQEYDLINHLACGLTTDEAVNQNFNNWGSNNSISTYQDLKNRGLTAGIEKFDLDEIFNEKQRSLIDVFFKTKHPPKIWTDSLNCKVNLRKSWDYVRGLTTYSYSFPIISEGIDHELYGIIIESRSFEVDNNTTTLKIFKKDSNSWELVCEVLLAMG